LLRLSPSSVSLRSWTSFAGIVVLSTVVPYVLNSWALARTGASKVAVYVFLQPLIATAFAVVVLNERLTGRAVLAGFLILAGLAVSVAQPRLPAEEVA
jgi:drug/metabolite transporter (DMT)-like permease